MTTPPRPPPRPKEGSLKPKVKAKARPPRIAPRAQRSIMEERVVRGRIQRAKDERDVLMHTLATTTSRMLIAPGHKMNDLIEKRKRVMNALQLSKKGQLFWEDVLKRGYPFPPPPPPPPPPGGGGGPPPPPMGGGQPIFVG